MQCLLIQSAGSQFLFIQPINYTLASEGFTVCGKKYNTINPSIVNSEKGKQRNRTLQSNHVGVTIINHTPN